MSRLKTNMNIPLIFDFVKKENNFTIYFLIPHYAKCDVMSGQKKNPN